MAITTDMKELSYKLHCINKRVLKSNLQQLIKEKYNGKGWRAEVAELLQMNVNTFNGVINPANISKITLERLIHIVDTLELDMDKVLANNKVVKSSQGNHKVKWTKEKQVEFVTDYRTKDINYVTNKYNIGEGTVNTYYAIFKQKVRIL